MFPVKFLLFALTFYGLVLDRYCHAITCPKGQKVKRMGGQRYACEPCPLGYYQPGENDSQKCRSCTACHAEKWSEIIQECTKETDTKCACRTGFKPFLGDSSICICHAGFGLKNGECAPCDAGYFTSDSNSQCRKWKECKAGVNITGTNTKDVICNEMSIKADVIFTSQHPQEETRSQTIFTTISNTISLPTVTTKQKGRADSPTGSNTSNHIGVVLLMFGIVGLLLLTTVTCKLHIPQNVQRKPAVQTKESLCSRPVEESGDGSELSVKLNLGEP